VESICGSAESILNPERSWKIGSFGSEELARTVSEVASNVYQNVSEHTLSEMVRIMIGTTSCMRRIRTGNDSKTCSGAKISITLGTI
jgi:hypothetical protein